MVDDLQTRESFLARLKDSPGNSAWEAFYERYSGVILCFCRKQGLGEFDSRDVLQETMVLLMRKLPDFNYDPERGRFRNWLLALVAGKVRDACRRARRARTVSLDDHGPEVNEPTKLAFLVQGDGADRILEKAWMQGLVEEALKNIAADPRTRPETFGVFQAYVIDGLPVAEVARQFRIQENTIYQIKNRFLKRLRDEVCRFEAPNLLDPN